MAQKNEEVQAVSSERFTVPDVYDIGPYTHIVKDGNTLYIAGQMARNLEGRNRRKT